MTYLALFNSLNVMRVCYSNWYSLPVFLEIPQKSDHSVPSNKWKQIKPVSRYYERGFPWSGPGFGLDLNSMLHLFQINSLTKKRILAQSLQHTGSDIFLIASNLNILLPSLAKNILWILDSCVELIFQLKFTLLLILHFILVHVMLF